MSFIKTKTQNNFYFEFFNIHISHLALHSMINMALMWHHKNITNKITIFIEFWRSPYVFFGSFDCDCTLLIINIKFKPMKSFIYIYPKTITYSKMCARLMLMNIIKNVWHLANLSFLHLIIIIGMSWPSP